MTLGILAFGAYIPRTRLSRRAMGEATTWFDRSLGGLAKGERSIGNWDEDPITMAVEAARDALGERDRSGIDGICLASTTFPFLDRLNSGVVAAALGLKDELSATDFASSQRAGTSALAAALSGTRTTLVVAAEQRPTRTANPLEFTSGDGAAALLIGDGKPVAKLLASAIHTADFVDHFRTQESQFDYRWEERWVRETGFKEILPPVIRQCLERAGVAAEDVTHFCLPTTLPRGADGIAKAAGIPGSAVVDNLQAVCGDTGSAHALVMLASALENAKPGDRILVVSFGQGADALLFEVTDAIAQQKPRLGVKGFLARRREETQYAKFLAFRDTIEFDRGMRSETDKQSPLSVMWRSRAAITALVGGRCTKCGTPQFPASRICVAPDCGGIDTQEPYGFSERIGTINSYTADLLTYAPNPPACYGQVVFKEGGRWMMDFTDIEAGDLAVGLPMRMVFRIREIDNQRGFRRYFWKAAPVNDIVKDA